MNGKDDIDPSIGAHGRAAETDILRNALRKISSRISANAGGGTMSNNEAFNIATEALMRCHSLTVAPFSAT